MPVHRTKPEVLAKSDAEIEAETARNWLQRSLDCYTLYHHTRDLEWLSRARSGEDEALEHAALVRDFGKTVKAIEIKLKQHHQKLKYSKNHRAKRP